jgi:hypothetical protein
MADCSLGACLEEGSMQLVASIGLIVSGLVIVNVGDSPPDMRVYGWIIAAVGVLGLLVRFMLPGAGRDRRGGPRGPGPPR